MSSATDPRELAAIFCGGVVGTIARAELAELLPRHADQWPWATFIVNVVGTALLAAVVARLAARPPRRRRLQPLLTTGLCGGLTTFSTLQVELLRMLDAGELALAAAYTAASVALGLAAYTSVMSAARRARWAR